MTIGSNIKKFRKELNLTQSELAEKSNISRTYLSDVENDRYNPSIDTLKDISKALSIDTEVLIIGLRKESELDEDLHIIQRIRNSLSEYDKEKMNDMLNIIITSFKDQIENLESE